MAGRVENLTPFKPGESGNPNGRPKGAFSLVGILKEKLQEIPDGMDGKTYAQLLIQRAMSIALKDGDVGMIRDMLDRVDGKPAQAVDLTSGGEKFETAPMSLAVLEATKRYEADLRKALIE